MQSRSIRRLSKIMASASRSMSFRQVAKTYQITTPKGKPNPGMVKRIIDGYQPKRRSTLERCPVPPRPPRIKHEPIRRVLIGAWRLRGHWISPEEFFGVKT
jgi:hypothetical protein